MKDKIKKVISEFKVTQYDCNTKEWVDIPLLHMLGSCDVDKLVSKIMKITKGK